MKATHSSCAFVGQVSRMPARVCASGSPVHVAEVTSVDGHIYLTESPRSCGADDFHHKPSAGYQAVLPHESIMCPPFGAKSECGLRSSMEDAISARPDLCTVPIPVGPQSQNDRWSSDVHGEALTSRPTAAALLDGCVDQSLHFFGVYDGHAGAQASLHCSKRLHYHLRNALQAAQEGRGIQNSSDDELCSSVSTLSDFTGVKPHHSDEYSTGDSTQSGTSASEMARSGHTGSWASVRKQAMTAAARSACIIQSGHSSGSSNPNSHPSSRVPSSSQQQDKHVVEAALRQAFLATDAELSKSAAFSLSGSAAVVAVVGQTHLWVANAGGRVLPAEQCGFACGTGAATVALRLHYGSRALRCT